ncbi:hypothetical protein [Pseudochryseolinea flava]|uniref:hypothetical protein n=1 Tax=Pseudochryseolinea flava TaxID=2059302 RepID=UPI001057C0D5|nr:hypothetical protein [Pseudochryseolinea flava]
MNLSLSGLYNFYKNEDKRQHINVNLSFQEAADKQGDIIKPGAVSQFYNMSTVYGLLFVPQAIHFTASVNTTYNHVGGKTYWITGPTLGVRAKVFKKTMLTGMSASYNVSYNDGTAENKVLNLRGNVGYIFMKKHNLTLNAVWQRRERLEVPVTTAVTTTFAYAYSF